MEMENAEHWEYFNIYSGWKPERKTGYLKLFLIQLIKIK